MEFTDGVKAVVVAKGRKKICNNSEQVFDYLIKMDIPHELSVDASSWTELASVGETYNETDFDIYME